MEVSELLKKIHHQQDEDSSDEEDNSDRDKDKSEKKGVKLYTLN